MTGEIPRIANVRRPRWLDSTQIVDIADDAEDEGRADIPANEMQIFKTIDLAMTAVDKTSGEPCYVVIECSYTVTQDDVTRVKRNAGHMARFTGIPASWPGCGIPGPRPTRRPSPSRSGGTGGRSTSSN